MSNQRSPTQRPRTRKDRHQLSSQYTNNGHDISFAQTMRGNRDYHNPSSQDRRDDCCCGVAAAVGVGVVAVDYAATGGATTAAALSTLTTVDPGTLANFWDGAIRISEGVVEHFGSRVTEVTSPMQNFANNIIDGINQLCSTPPSTDDTIATLGISSVAASRPAREWVWGCLTNVTDRISEISSSTSENSTPANSPSLQSFLGFLGFDCTTRGK